MTSIIRPLPTPNQIRKDPERVALHGLAHAIELTLRALDAIHPGCAIPNFERASPVLCPAV